MADDKTGNPNELVAVTDWKACYNKDEGVLSLSCTVASKDPSKAISGVGLLLNNSQGSTLASTYTDLSNASESVTPALNLPPGDLKVGDTVWGAVSGEVNDQHYFFEQELLIEPC